VNPHIELTKWKHSSCTKSLNSSSQATVIAQFFILNTPGITGCHPLCYFLQLPHYSPVMLLSLAGSGMPSQVCSPSLLSYKFDYPEPQRLSLLITLVIFNKCSFFQVLHSACIFPLWQFKNILTSIRVSDYILVLICL
jgi:hypothetical protein